MLLSNGNDKKFFGLIKESGLNMRETAELFQEMTGNLAAASDYARRLKELESKGDQVTHELILMLNRLFVTPLEREDILHLGQRMDDVTDGIEAVASRLAIYGITEADGFIFELANIVQRQAEEIAVAVDCLGSRQYARIREISERIHALENQGDETLRASLEHVFKTVRDPIRLVQLKEIYESLEEVTDRAEDVADSLQSVVMKNG